MHPFLIHQHPLNFFQPPTMKAGELEKRGERRAEAMAAIEKAKEEGDMEEVDKQSRRIVKVLIRFIILITSHIFTILFWLK